jgi:hypothetical protein
MCVCRRRPFHEKIRDKLNGIISKSNGIISCTEVVLKTTCLELGVICHVHCFHQSQRTTIRLIRLIHWRTLSSSSSKHSSTVRTMIHFHSSSVAHLCVFCSSSDHHRLVFFRKQFVTHSHTHTHDLCTAMWFLLHGQTWQDNQKEQ